jgi:hypothetical protein
LVQPFKKVDLNSYISLDSLGKVRRHISLEIEIGELVSLLKLQESSKLRVGVDLATIGLVLELVSADILVDITSDLSASHLGTSRLLKELGKLIGNTSGLDKARGSTTTSSLLSLT